MERSLIYPIRGTGDENRPVSHDMLLSLAEAARWAPSSFNDQPWRFMVWDRFKNRSSWQKALECLVEKNQSWVYRAPLLWASFASRLDQRGKPTAYGEHDTGAASENLCLQAEALGLMAHQMAGFDKQKLSLTFQVPSNFTPMAMIAVGFPGPPEQLPEDLRQHEMALRTRLPLEQILYQGAWSGA